MPTFDELCDLARLHKEVVDRGVDLVLADLRAAVPLASQAGKAQAAKKLASLLRAVDLEAHHLRGWSPGQQPGFFLQQLRNRSFESGWDDLQAAAERVLAERHWPYLRQLVTSGRGPTRLLRTLEGHSDTVSAVALTPSGRFAVSASKDKTLRVWDLDTGHTARTIKAHPDEIKGVAVFGNGRRVISASIDRTLKIWDLETCEEVRTLTGHRMGVWGVAVTGDGSRAVSTGMDGKCAVWNVTTGERARLLEGHREPVLAAAAGRHFGIGVTAGMDGVIKVWDLDTGDLVRGLFGHTMGVWAVALNEDASRALSASADRTLRLWDLRTGQALRVFEGHAADVTGVQWLDGDRAITASLDGTLKVWDLSNGAELCTLSGHSAGVTAVAVSADGRLAVSASKDKTLKVWSLEGPLKEPRARARVGWPGQYESNAGLYRVSVSNDGRWVIGVRTDGSLKIWDLTGHEEVRSLAGHAQDERDLKDVREARIDEDGRWGATVSYSGDVTVWDLEIGRVVRTVHCAPAAWKVGLRGDGRVAVAASALYEINVWDLETGEIVRKLGEEPTEVHAVKVSADGSRVMVLVWDRPSRVWDLKTGQVVASVHTGASLNAFSENGQWALAAAPSYNVTDIVEVLDISRGYARYRVNGKAEMAIRRDGRRVVFANGSLCVMDPVEQLSALSLGADAPMTCCTFLPNGSRTIIAGDAMGNLHMVEEM